MKSAIHPSPLSSSHLGSETDIFGSINNEKIVKLVQTI
jgi:hypothetical protein